MANNNNNSNNNLASREISVARREEAASVREGALLEREKTLEKREADAAAQEVRATALLGEVRRRERNLLGLALGEGGVGAEEFEGMAGSEESILSSEESRGMREFFSERMAE
ncbi:hypothetical protein LTR37_001439 [Vermiconidia calcicola]|uniref:Uncharacterized protein n=1 Tax=Vermiconidia calcicola TaxID=1690605 RepID=A0ACC3NVZ6_9PEZI|nr:hypothetical protein LTR37_001439 [Vermiconidia calcicola]